MRNKKKYSILIISLAMVLAISACGCALQMKTDALYFLKTEPERAVIDFINYLNDKEPQYIYDNLLTNDDKTSISREKFTEEILIILSDVEEVKVLNTIYLGYENNLSKVVAEVEVSYKNGETKQYKRYMYLIEENKLWKIIMEKTFI